MSESVLSDNSSQSSMRDSGLETRCANCGEDMQGQFCHQCGQSSKNMVKFFGEVAKEIMDDVFGYDSRLKHSLYPLFFKPGKLTQEYSKGKRFFYVLPFRLYLFSSIILMLVLQMNLQFNLSEKGTALSEAKKELKSIKEHNVAKKINSKMQQIENKTDSKSFSNKIVNEKNRKGIYFETGDIDTEHNKFISISGATGFFKKAIDDINKKAEGWKKDPSPLLDEFLRLLPYMMFIIIPLFALVTKLFYLFSKRFYIEHLIFSLHNHSFIFLVLVLNIGFQELQEILLKQTFTGAAFLSSLFGWLSVLGFIWMAVYVFLAVKRVYQQSWFMTITKTTLLSVVYLTLSSVGTLITLIIGAYRA